MIAFSEQRQSARIPKCNAHFAGADGYADADTPARAKQTAAVPRSPRNDSKAVENT
jgi:hypothetical protein